VLLQAEIAQRPGRGTDAVIRESTHRNPYTGHRWSTTRRPGSFRSSA
jgi:hypothetical protein